MYFICKCALHLTHALGYTYIYINMRFFCLRICIDLVCKFKLLFLLYKNEIIKK